MMGESKSLLVELFVEELPPKALKKLGDAFAGALLDKLKAEGLASEHSALTAFASPRRLAAHVSAVRAQAADRAVSHKLMPVAVGLAADGAPTPALLKKLAALGADASVVPTLARRADGKAETLFLDSQARGALLAEGLQRALDASLAALPIPKVMTYQLDDGWTSVNFVRPAHGLVALHGADVVPVAALGLSAGRQTRGHRFEAPVDPVVLQDADHYARQLEEQGAVIASFAHRRAEIARQLAHAAAAEGGTPIDDDALLDEVTALVERPNVLPCRFEEQFLAVPQECLILTMKANQKYFPLLDAQGRLTNRFLVVSNIRPADPALVVGGNERVVRPRLADAKFFFEQDRKKSLADRVPGLAKVVYHAKLGTMGERVERVCAIARAIGAQLGGPALAAAADQAALLAKADLLTDMVGEFPELQGVMGGYYARHDGLTEQVALAIEDHYKPRFAGDALPRGDAGLAVALADKLETLAGLFGIGQLPSGDKDPFALRRHALGVIRMLVERRLPVDLDELLSVAEASFGSLIAPKHTELMAFIDERVRQYFSAQGAIEESTQALIERRSPVIDATDRAFSPQQIDAVMALKPRFLLEVPGRLKAVAKFSQLPEAAALAAANKRVGNILKKSDAALAAVDPALFAEPAERSLHAALQAVTPAADAAFAAGDYSASLQALAALKAPVDAFFDTVMVNAEDPRLRANRLGLLSALHAAMNRVADLSRLAT